VRVNLFLVNQYLITNIQVNPNLKDSHQIHQDLIWDHQDSMDHTDKDFMDHEDSMDHKDYMVHQDSMDHKDHMDHMDNNFNTHHTISNTQECLNQNLLLMDHITMKKLIFNLVIIIECLENI